MSTSTGDIAEPHPTVPALRSREAEFERLLDFIARQFHDEAGGPDRFPARLMASSTDSYEANGYFTALLGCNTWTARALREAGLQTGWWNPLPLTLRLVAGAAQLNLQRVAQRFKSGGSQP